MSTWKLESYLDDHEIPYCLKAIYKTETRWETTRQVWQITGYEPYTRVCAIRPKKNGAKKTETKYEVVTDWRAIHDYVTVPLAEPRKHMYRTLLGYRLTWWSDKDIGIDYVLNRCLMQP